MHKKIQDLRAWYQRQYQPTLNTFRYKIKDEKWDQKTNFVHKCGNVGLLIFWVWMMIVLLAAPFSYPLGIIDIIFFTLMLMILIPLSLRLVISSIIDIFALRKASSLMKKRKQALKAIEEGH